MLEAESIPGHIAAGNVMSMKNSNDTIGYRIRDLAAFSAVPQTTAPSRAPITTRIDYNITVWTTMAYYQTLPSVFTGAAREYYEGPAHNEHVARLSTINF
jgi:hypothetical protein